MNERDGAVERVEAVRGSLEVAFLKKARGHEPELRSIDDLGWEDPGALFRQYHEILKQLPDRLVLLLEPPANPIAANEDREQRWVRDVLFFFEQLNKDRLSLDITVDCMVLYLREVPGVVETNIMANKESGYRIEETSGGRKAVIIPKKAKG